VICKGSQNNLQYYDNFSADFLVGDSIRTIGPSNDLGYAVQCVIAGSRKDKILPYPFSHIPIKSVPLKITGQAVH